MIQTKMQSKEWKHEGSPSSCKFKRQPFVYKIMASVFWDAKGVLFIYYLPKGSTFTGVYYANLIPKLLKNIKSKKVRKNQQRNSFSSGQCAELHLLHCNDCY